MEAAARHLLRFDERWAFDTDGAVDDNVGLLDFSHALTFGHALRRQCERQPWLWSQGLPSWPCLWAATSAIWTRTFPRMRRCGIGGFRMKLDIQTRAIVSIIDHGIGLPIFPAHWLKTWSATRDEVAAGLPQSVRVGNAWRR